MRIDLSVVIPTYNGEKTLPGLLERLRAQISTTNISWEVIVVDNNSTDNTAKIVKDYQANWPQEIPLSYYLEPRQGAENARQRGVDESGAELIAFLDDDCLPALNWVKEAYQFGKENPLAGAWGSQIHGKFLAQPPEGFAKIQNFLGVTERGPKPFPYTSAMKVLPKGCGLVVRRKAWFDCVPRNFALSYTGRDSLFSSVDIEMALHIQLGGWEIWYNPGMEIDLPIHPEELVKDSLLKRFLRTGISRYRLRILRARHWPKPIYLFLCTVKDFFEISGFFLTHYKKIKADLVTRCQMQHLWSTFLSPIYNLKAGKDKIQLPRSSAEILDFSVVIPTRNGEKRLIGLLGKLKEQINPRGLKWEVIVVDNNSTDNTKRVVEEFHSSWPKDNPLRYCFEPKQGSAFARQRGVDESRGELVGFLDDDNLPEPDWIAEAWNFGIEHPKVGAWASQVIGKYEGVLPGNFKKLAPLLGITEWGSQAYRFHPNRGVLPPGNGLVARREDWVKAVPHRLVLNFTGGEIKGDDLEAELYIQKSGREIWYNPKMKVYHAVPKERTEAEYLLMTCRSTGISRYYLRMIRFKAWQRPFVFFAYVLNDLRKIIFHYLRFGPKIKDDIVLRCQMELYMNSLRSHFQGVKRFLRKDIKS